MCRTALLTACEQDQDGTSIDFRQDIIIVIVIVKLVVAISTITFTMKYRILLIQGKPIQLVL